VSGIVGERVGGEKVEGVVVREAGERFGLGGFALYGSCLILYYNVLSDPVLLGGGTRRRQKTIRRVRGKGVTRRGDNGRGPRQRTRHGDNGRGPRQRTRGIWVGAMLKVGVRGRVRVRLRLRVRFFACWRSLANARDG
jgi:hypothetical protein